MLLSGITHGRLFFVYYINSSSFHFAWVYSHNDIAHSVVPKPSRCGATYWVYPTVWATVLPRHYRAGYDVPFVTAWRRRSVRSLPRNVDYRFALSFVIGACSGSGYTPDRPNFRNRVYHAKLFQIIPGCLIHLLVHTGRRRLAQTEKKKKSWRWRQHAILATSKTTTPGGAIHLPIIYHGDILIILIILTILTILIILIFWYHNITTTFMTLWYVGYILIFGIFSEKLYVLIFRYFDHHTSTLLYFFYLPVMRSPLREYSADVV